MKQRGAAIVDPADIPTLGKFDDSEFEVLLYEFKADLNKYLTWLGPDVAGALAEGRHRVQRGEPDEEMPYFGQEILTMAEKKGPLTTPSTRRRWRRTIALSRAQGIDAVMTKHKLDALVAPTGGPAWLTDLVNGDGTSPGGASTPPPVAGYPHITVPAGLRPRTAGRPLVLRRRLERADADQVRVRVRAGDEARRPPRSCHCGFGALITLLRLEPPRGTRLRVPRCEVPN